MKYLTSIQSKALCVFSLNLTLILVAVSRAIIYDRNPMRYFRESGYITWLSFFQLLFIGYLCYKLSKLRFLQAPTWQGWRHPGRIWQVMSLGFVFLALDEYFQIHETVDEIIRRYFGLQDPAWDRIDDFIVLFYVFAGVAFLLFSKSEFRQFSSSLKWFSLGFCFCFLTIALDMWTQNSSALSFLAQGEEQIRVLSRWLRALEESFKVLAEAAFVVAFEHCLMIASCKRRTPEGF